MTLNDSAPPRRVLIVSRSLPCHVSGGLEFHVVDQAVGLAHAGIEVHLLSTPIPSAYREELKSHNISFHALEHVPCGVYTWAYLSRIAQRILSLHQEHHFHIIHGHEFALGSRPSLYGQLNSIAPCKLALTVHGTITTETPLHPDVFAELSPLGKLRALAKFGRRWLFAPAWHATLNLADVIFVDSEFTRSELKRIRPAIESKVKLVPLSIEMNRYPPLDHVQSRRELNWSNEGNDVILLTVGRLEWQKGHDIALRAMATLDQLNWKYVIIGAGTESARLEGLSIQLGISDRVTFMGRVSDELKSKALAGADLFIWPERTHPAFGLAGLESLVMGTPVVAARRGAIPELIDESNGALFEAHNPTSLARAVAPLLSGRTHLDRLRIGLRERTLARVEPDRMINATLSAYERALKS